MIYGRAFILGSKYPAVCKRSRAPHKAICCDTDDGFVDFSVVQSITKAWATDDKTHGIEWYGLWRDSHSFSSAHIPKVIEKAKKLEVIAVMNPQKRFYFAPFLEHRKDKPFMFELFRQIAAVAPSLTLVNNPISGGGQFLNDVRYVDEVHLDGGMGKPAKRYFVSVDGRADEKKGHGNGSVDMDHKAQVAKYPKAEVWMDWCLQDNGKRNTKDKTKRKDRKAWLTIPMDESVCFLGTDPCEISLAKGHLWKSHAEQHGDDCNNPEGNRPVYISAKTRYKKVQLTDTACKVLATITQSVKYKHGDGWLYRFPRWGYKYAQLAKAATGVPTCLLVCDGKTIGEINSGFRCPGR